MNTHLLAFAAAALVSTHAAAADFSFTGNFARDNDRAEVAFTLDAAGDVTIRSLGFSGGVNAAGTAIDAGGFDPILSLYDANGTLVVDNDDADATTSDPLLALALDAGTYRVFLTQYNNFGPLSLPGAFAFDGEPDFRGGFVDFFGNQRTSAYAFDILGVATAVPEIATAQLLLAGIALAGFAARRRAR